MRKNILAASMALMASAIPSVAETVDFTYAGDVATAYTLGQPAGTEIYLAIEIPAELSTRYASAEITAVNITTGAYASASSTGYANKITDVTVFISEDLQSTPVYTQSATLGTVGFTAYAVDLDEPYVIEAGKPVYVGYYFKNTTAPSAGTEFYVPVDGIAVDNMPEACWYGYKSGSRVLWGTGTDEIGSLALGCTISGDALPQNGATLLYPSGLGYAEPGAEFSYSLALRGAAVNAAENVEVTYTVGSAEPVAVTLPVASGPTMGGEATVTVSGMVCNTVAENIPLTFEITKVNGEENISVHPSAETTFNCFKQENGFDRVHLIEEATGTWCPWCVRGIYMIEYVKEKYPDMFIPVALHYNDTMSNTTCNSVLTALQPGGYPYMFIDRVIADDPGYLQYIDLVAKATVPATVGITSLTGEVAEDGTLTIDTDVRFLFDTDNSGNRYRLAYYLVQDGVGPYRQQNGYAGGANGKFYGWESKASSVSMLFDDVARLAVGTYRGFSGSIPAAPKAGEDYSYSTTAVTSAVTAADFTVVAFIVDNETGEVVNAARSSVNNPWFSSISEVKAAGKEGTTWFDINGRPVANPTAPGLYIGRTVGADGSVTSVKKLVK